jgi:hypothetical protein
MRLGTPPRSSDLPFDDVGCPFSLPRIPNIRTVSPCWKLSSAIPATNAFCTEFSKSGASKSFGGRDAPKGLPARGVGPEPHQKIRAKLGLFKRLSGARRVFDWVEMAVDTQQQPHIFQASRADTTEWVNQAGLFHFAMRSACRPATRRPRPDTHPLAILLRAYADRQGAPLGPDRAFADQVKAGSRKLGRSTGRGRLGVDGCGIGVA